MSDIGGDLSRREGEFVLFEGLNRFYVAREDEALLARFPRSQAEWQMAPHLGHTNRAPLREDHPDHAFAKRLVSDFLARPPFVDSDMLLGLVTRTEDEAELLAPPSEAGRHARSRGCFPTPPAFRMRARVLQGSRPQPCATSMPF